MADAKISALTELTSVDSAADFLPIVDTSATETKKVTTANLGAVLSLSNLLNLDINKKAVTIQVKNSTGSSIAAGKICYISGDSSGTPTIALAKADAASTSSKMLIMTNASISNGATGVGVVLGYVTGLSSLTAGSIYYIDASTAGSITATAPSTSTNIVRIIGYAMSTTELFFEPDGTYVEV